MKKLTAGIFAGILTIVTVNAADAAIASKAYVDQKDAANATAITNLTQTVGGHTTSITELKTTVEGLTTGDNSVAGQIADALGEDFPADSTVQAELEKKANKADLGTMASKNADDYSTTAQMNTALANKLDTSKATVAADANYIKSGDGVATNLGLLDTQVKGNADNISGINTKIGTLPEGETSVVTMIQKVETAAGTNVDEKLGDLGEGNDTVADALAKKQNMLNGTNVKETGNGNAIVSITAADGVVTATKGAVIPEVTTTGQTGTYVLTATVTESGVTNYMWESIERATAQTTEP